jgi:hypothetical protein
MIEIREALDEAIAVPFEDMPPDQQLGSLIAMVAILSRLGEHLSHCLRVGRDTGMFLPGTFWSDLLEALAERET